MAASATVPFFQDGGCPVIRMLGPPTMRIWWSYHCAKFGWNRCSCFDNMHVFSISRVFASKRLFTPQNW